MGTTSQNGSVRQVKVEVLGIMDPLTKFVRLRAVEPVPVSNVFLSFNRSNFISNAVRFRRTRTKTISNVFNEY